MLTNKAPIKPTHLASNKAKVIPLSVAYNSEILPKASPFVKWVGGKRSIIHELLKRLPLKYNSYYECFLGGGALFFELQPQKAFLSDLNIDLLLTYETIRKEPEKVIILLKEHQKRHNKEYYYQIRAIHNSKDPYFSAARMIYLNKTCFNGLWRVNKKGEFNVPMGSYLNPSICQEDNILACSKILKNSIIKFDNFLNITPNSGDFVYLDPPYHPIIESSFTAYSIPEFSEKEQKELASFCTELTKKGVHIMLSNSNTQFIRKLYSANHFKIDIVNAPRAINCKANGRGAIQEVLITNY